MRKLVHLGGSCGNAELWLEWHRSIRPAREAKRLLQHTNCPSEQFDLWPTARLDTTAIKQYPTLGLELN